MSTEPNQLHLPASGNDSVFEAWRDVVLNELSAPRSGTGVVRPEIMRSWKQCKILKLDPLRKNFAPMISSRELGLRLEANHKLIALSQPVLKMIDIAIKDTGFIAFITDKEGCILIVGGHSGVLEVASKNQIKTGMIRSTKSVGTGGTGLCIDENRAVQVTGAEHYMLVNHLWTCSSAPIHDDKGLLTGTITLSGKSIGKHQHTLGLVKAAAEIIESQLRESSLIEERQNLNDMLASIIDSMSEGIIAIDNNDRITKLNRVASGMIGLDPVRMIGEPLKKIVQMNNKVRQTLQNKIAFPGAEIGFRCADGLKSYMCRVDPIKSHTGIESGKLITMVEKKEMIHVAGKITGNYAKYTFDDIVGKNDVFQNMKKMARAAAKTNSRVLIVGESGTGKELVAQAIHNFSQRKNRPFIAISCAAIPRDLMESEFFGYKGGTFTGARRDGMVGKFELANTGTLFLDEINSLPLELQSKLLRALQQNEIMKLGGSKPIPVDIRILAASSIDLLNEIRHNNFREDLYYRLNVMELFIPPLRSRIDDMELLVNHILQRQSRAMGFREPSISPDALEMMMNYSWPGNVRELENCIERALLLSEGKTINRKHLFMRQAAMVGNPEPEPVSLRKNDRLLIENALKKNNYNITQTAKMLGISRPTLYNKMKKFKIR